MQVEGLEVVLHFFFSISAKTLSGLKGWILVAKESLSITDSTSPTTVYAFPL